MDISIVITNYNYEEYLNECIESCLLQQYSNDFEIIVVDDGSNDDSRKIIRGYNSRIKTIFKSNGGQASAFNTGFSACTGEIIIFLDSDDMLMPNCLNKLSKIWRDSFSKIHFNLLMIDKSGNSLGEPFCKTALPRGDLKESILKTGHYQSMPTSGNAFSRAFLNRVLPMPEADWRGHADAYLINLAALAGCVGAIDEPLGYYRIHDKNISSHIIKRQLCVDKLHASILREVNTDKIIYKFCNINDFEYKTGRLMNTYPHLQQVMVYNKLAHQFNRDRLSSPLMDFIKLTASIFRLANMPYIKIMLIHSWMFLILMAPAKFAERMVTFGYERGAMLFARRPPPEKKEQILPPGSAIRKPVL